MELQGHALGAVVYLQAVAGAVRVIKRCARAGFREFALRTRCSSRTSVSARQALQRPRSARAQVPELNVQNGVLKALSFLFEYIGEMGKDYIYAVSPLLEDALMDRDLVHRQTAASVVQVRPAGSLIRFTSRPRCRCGSQGHLIGFTSRPWCRCGVQRFLTG